MNNVILFESADCTYYGGYNLETHISIRSIPYNVGI